MYLVKKKKRVEGIALNKSNKVGCLHITMFLQHKLQMEDKEGILQHSKHSHLLSKCLCLTSSAVV